VGWEGGEVGKAGGKGSLPSQAKELSSGEGSGCEGRRKGKRR
jgi:hypothetical protein